MGLKVNPSMLSIASQRGLCTLVLRKFCEALALDFKRVVPIRSADSSAQEFSGDTDVNDIVWERFSAQQQADEIWAP